MDLGRKVSGGKYHARRKSRLYEKRNQEREVILGDMKRKTLRVKGGHHRTIMLKASEANIVSGKTIKKAQITNVIETPHNRFMARQNRLSKGAIIETSLGKARITNRPTREGHINAILLKE